MVSHHEKAMKAYAKRRQQAVLMRKKGMKLRDIATKMGVSHQAISSWLKNESKKAGCSHEH